MNSIDAIYSILTDIMGLSLFSAVRDTPVLCALRDLLEDMSDEKSDTSLFALPEICPDITQDWSAFTAAFIRCQKDYSFYLTIAALTSGDDNPYTLAAETQETIPPVLAAVAKADLARLGRIASLEIHSLGFHIAEMLKNANLKEAAQGIEEESRVLYAEGKKAQTKSADPLLKIFPEPSAETRNWGAALPALTEYLHKNGAGILGRRRSFRWTPPAFSQDIQDNSLALQPLSDFILVPAPLSLFLRPVQNPDPVRIGDLCGYEDQRSPVIANTLRFLEGKQANNLLLYGDRGTGKSATVKAVCNEYANRALKLIEINKSDLVQLPSILDLLAERALRFVIFIDDLSFETADDSFRSLKALLEGGIETRPKNVVIYATSNRRHLVKERASDRPTAAEAAESLNSGDVRAFDTMQEQFSLADRFGLTVVFTAPGQEEYLRIAEHIAGQRGVLSAKTSARADEEKRERFRSNAIRWERWFNGRSPRTAVQYVDWIAGGADFPWE
jgi:predicted AAA+ superfamily ATPase